MNNDEQIFIESTTELRNWLEEHHQQASTVWLVRWKKLPDKPYISYDEVVDELICFGWVDSLPKKLDEQRTMLRISPRNPNSNWSKVNKERVERLMDENRMHSSGMDLIEVAKENGRWDFLNDVEALIIPKDLQEALEKEEKALFYFERFPPSSKRGILEWIKNAKQENTRQKRVTETALKASRNIKANHPKGRDAGPKEK